MKEDDGQAEMPEGDAHKITVIGVGGAGCNVLDRIALDGLDDAELVGMHTDMRALANSMVAERVQLGEDVTRGLGAGGDPEVGRAAAEAAADAVRRVVARRELVFICAGLGGGTGSGAAPLVARLAREAGAFVVTFAVLPFTFEGRRRFDQAREALERLAAASDVLLTFENSRLGELVLPKEGIQAAFAAADEIIGRGVRAVTGIVLHPGIIKLGLDELIAALRNRDSRCLFGFGEASGENRAHEAVAAALKSPLLDKGRLLGESDQVLVHIAGGPSMTLFEVELVMRELRRHVAEGAHLLFGTGSDEALGNRLAVTVISSIAAPRESGPSPDESAGGTNASADRSAPRVEPAVTAVAGGGALGKQSAPDEQAAPPASSSEAPIPAPVDEGLFSVAAGSVAGRAEAAEAALPGGGGDAAVGDVTSPAPVPEAGPASEREEPAEAVASEPEDIPAESVSGKASSEPSGAGARLNGTGAARSAMGSRYGAATMASAAEILTPDILAGLVDEEDEDSGFLHEAADREEEPPVMANADLLMLDEEEQDVEMSEPVAEATPATGESEVETAPTREEIAPRDYGAELDAEVDANLERYADEGDLEEAEAPSSRPAPAPETDAGFAEIPDAGEPSAFRDDEWDDLADEVPASVSSERGSGPWSPDGHEIADADETGWDDVDETVDEREEFDSHSREEEAPMPVEGVFEAAEPAADPEPATAGLGADEQRPSAGFFAAHPVESEIDEGTSAESAPWERPTGGHIPLEEREEPEVDEWAASPGATDPRVGDAGAFDDRFVPEEEDDEFPAAAGGGGRSPGSQAELEFEPAAQGRFEKSTPTIVDGENLDVPTFLRKRRQ